MKSCHSWLPLNLEENPNLVQYSTIWPVWFLSLTSSNSSIITDCWLATVVFSYTLTTSHLFPISGLLFFLFFLLGITLNSTPPVAWLIPSWHLDLSPTVNSERRSLTTQSILQTPSWLILLFYFTHSLPKLFFIKFFIFYPNKNVSSTSGETVSVLFTVKMTITNHGT